MQRRDFLARTLAAGVAFAALPWLQTLGAETLGAKTPGARPNIVLIMVDDMGYSDIGCFGAEMLKTLVDQWKTWSDQVQWEARPANLFIPPAVPE